MKTLPVYPLLVLASAVLLQTGCVQLAEVDSTRSPAFAPMIGREFELKEEFGAFGIKLPPKFDHVDYVLIMPPPGIFSRYRILDLGKIAAGSRFKIVGVVTRRSELFPSTEYVVSFADRDFGLADGTPIRINATSTWRLYTKPTSPESPPQLNERFFLPVGASSMLPSAQK